MKAVKTLPPVEFLHQCFNYDPETGRLIWKTRPREHFKDVTCFTRYNRQTVGKVAGITMYRDKDHTNPNGVVVPITYAGLKTIFYAHRIIFALQGIDVPADRYIDHVNGCPTDNRWVNLRLATPQQNTQNKKASRKKREPLPRGVHKNKQGTFYATIWTDGKNRRLGTFLTSQEANQAYCSAAKVLHGEFFRPQ